MTENAPNRRLLLVFACFFTIGAWQFAWGRTLLYPFSLFATYVHEMGHGLTAMLLGAQFHQLEIHADGSGVAQWSGQVGAIGRALIAAGGLVGPSVAGGLLLVLSRNKHSQLLLSGLALLVLVSVPLWVRSLLGWALLLPMGTLLLGVAWKKGRWASFFLQFLGAQMCLAVYRDLNYMFSQGAIVNGTPQLSDSAAMADALLLPYWFWGGLTAAFSLGVLAIGLFVALRQNTNREFDRSPRD